MLPALDQAYLGALNPAPTVSTESGMICVAIPGFVLPAGFTRTSSDLLLRLSPGYPDLQPDMWWFCPLVQRIDGQPIEATQSMENYLGRTWQRWSRHLNPGQWRPGVDSIESYLALVRRELGRASGLRAA